MKTNYRFKLNFEASDNYNYYEEDDKQLTFEAEVAEPVSPSALNDDAEFISKQLTSKNAIKFGKVWIENAMFKDEKDASSGYCEIEFELESMEPITDTADLQYICECVSEDVIKYVKAHIEGYVYVINDVAIPSLSDMQYGLGEEEERVDIDEHCAVYATNLPYDIHQL